MPLKVFGGSLLLPLRIDGYTFDQLPYTPSVDERFSTQLKDQLPDFVVSNYDAFLSFVESYYEWSEQHGNPRAEGVRLNTYKDIDETLDGFLEYFRNTYIRDFPFTLADGVSEKNLIKNVGDMYRAKGSKASFDLLFRILYNTTIDVNYPKDRILKLSDSRFDDRQFIRIGPSISIEEAKTIENSLIVQRSGSKREIYATALIDKVDYVHEGGFDFFSLAVEDVSGEFNTENFAEIVTSGVTATSYKVSVLPTLESLQINAGGTGYELGDTVTVTDSGGQKLLKAQINNIGPLGQIRGFEYKNNFGVYRDGENTLFSFETFSGTGASLSAGPGAVLTDGPDTYLDDTGRLSGRSFIQDSFFYQNYSYIIRVDKSLRVFADAVRRLVHPSGTLMFAEFINEVSLSGDAGLTSDARSRFIPIIGHYLPHTFGTTIDPRGFTLGAVHTDFYPTGYNGQDGRTAGDFVGLTLSSGASGTPHLFPELGHTHNPDKLLFGDASGLATPISFPFDGAETTRTIVDGSLGGTGYIGVTTDTDGEHAGLFGAFPAGSNRTNAFIAGAAGVTHFGGYTSPSETSLSGGFSGGQIIQVVGTDSATADFWIVYRHPAHLGLENLGTTGSREVVRIPVKPVAADEDQIQTINPSSDGYYYQDSAGITLNGTPYLIGEIVTQEKPNEPLAIGRVVQFNASAHHQGLGTPFYNIGVDILEIEVLNGRFTKGLLDGDINKDGKVNASDLSLVLSKFGLTGGIADVNQDGKVDGADLVTVLSGWNQTPRPIVGESSGAARLVDDSFVSDTYRSVVYDTSWMDIPISVMVNDIEYSNVTN
tara:strand:+ start:5525 stop:7990 length:2466 start_codon:yes stop_codon:yes gene_type:complete